MANSLSKKPTKADIEAYALKYQIMISKTYDVFQSQQSEQDTSKMVNSVERALKKTIQINAPDAPSSNGAMGEVVKADFVEEGLHVMFNASELKNRDIDLQRISEEEKKTKYGNFQHFAAPISYLQDEMLNYGGTKYIGLLNGNDGGTQVYQGAKCELFLPIAFDNTLPTTRTKGKNIQDYYLEKCKKLNEIAEVVKQTMRKLYKTDEGYSFQNGEYGQLYYAMFYDGIYQGWHRGIDMNYQPWADTPFYSLTDGIVVGRSDWTSLDVFIPVEEITITFMHFNPQKNGSSMWPIHLSMGSILKKGDLIAYQSDKGVKGSIHIHMEINAGCCRAAGAQNDFRNSKAISKEELDKSLNTYYTEALNDINENESLNLSFCRSVKEKMEIKDIYKKRKEKIYKSLEKSILLPKKFNSSYSREPAKLDSLYPYDYLKKWC